MSFFRTFKLAFLVVLFGVVPQSAWSVEPQGFSLTRGWPDLGRAASSTMGVGQLNPAGVARAPRYEAAAATNYLPPTGDWALHLGLSDSQTASLSAEATYSFIRHSLSNPGSYGGNGNPLGTKTHRINIALAELYGDIIQIGIRGGVDIRKAQDIAATWSYGLGVAVPIGDMFRIAVETGDWFANAKSPYQSRRVGGGIAIMPVGWLALVGDGLFRWKVPGLNSIWSAGGGISLSYEEIVTWRAGYRWNPKEDGHVVSSALQGVVFPWMFSGDVRYSSTRNDIGFGVTISILMFTDS